MPTDDDQEDGTASWVNPVAEVASNLVTAAAGALGGPEASGAAAGASPVVRKAFESLGRRWSGLSQRGGERVLEEAEAAGLPVVNLEDRISGSDQRLMLAGAAIEAGTRTVNPEKIRALGRALAAGVTDDALVDPELLAVAALADMEAPHVKVLRHIAEEFPHRTVTRDELKELVAQRRQPEWSRRDLTSALPEVALVIEPVVGTLIRHGLVEEVDQVSGAIAALEKQQEERDQREATYGGRMSGRRTFAVRPSLHTRWQATTFGRHVLGLLREAGEPPP